MGCRLRQGSENDPPEIERIRAALRTDSEVTVKLPSYRKDGTPFFNEFTIRPLFDRNGNPVYYLGVQHDVTNELLATEEVKRLAEQITTLPSSSPRP